MRHIVLIIMIVLLPVRSWAGDVMATQMASSALSAEFAIDKGAAGAHELGAKASFDAQNQAVPDCHEALSGLHDSDTNFAEAAVSDHCVSCQACQACHTTALLPALLEFAASLRAHPLHAIGAAFTSAATALSQKPPIS